MSETVKNLFACIFLFLFVVLYFFLLKKFNPYYFLTSDNATYYLPSYLYNYKSLINHNIVPLINYHQYLGTQYFAQGQTAVFYIPVYIAAFVSKLFTKNFFSTISFLAFVHISASVIGMYLLLIRLKTKKFLAILGSIMWITFPFIILVSKGWIFISYTVAYLPINFLLIDKFLQNPKLKYAIFLSLLKGLFFYQGYIQYLFFMVFLESIFVLLYIRLKIENYIDTKPIEKSFKNLFQNQRLRLFIRNYFISFVLLIGLVAPLLFPMYELQSESFYRSGQLGLGDFLGEKLTLYKFRETQLFNFGIYGAFHARNEIFFFGIINLFLFFASIVYAYLGKFKNRKEIYVFQILTFLTFLFSTRFYLIFHPIPVFNYFRWPFKYYLFFLFFSTIALVLSSNEICKRKNQKFYISICILFLMSISMNIYAFFLKPNSILDKNTLTKSSSYLDSYINPTKGRVFTHHIKENPFDRYSDLYTHNFATLYEKYHFAGYDPLRSKQINQLAQGIDLRFLYKFSFPDLDKDFINYLNNWSVKYFIFDIKNYYSSYNNVLPNLKPLYKNTDIILLENSKSLPLVFYYNGEVDEFDSNDSNPDIDKAKIKFLFGVNEINVYPDIDQEKTLIINVAPLKWYKFYIDGVDKGFIDTSKPRAAIKIPKETKKVTLKYVDYSFYAGCGVFLLTLFSIFFILIINYKRNKEVSVDQ